MSNLTIRTVTGIEEFESLQKTWGGLIARSGDNNVFLTWEWLFTWWQHFGQGKKLNILVIEDGSNVIGIVPLMLSRYQWGPFSYDVLESLGSASCDYHGVILTERKEDCANILLAYLKDELVKNKFLRMTQIPEDSEFLALIRKRYPPFSKSLVLEEKVSATCPYVALPATWDEYFYSVRRKRRGNLRRSLQSLQNEHAVEWKEQAGAGDLREQIQGFFELKKKRWDTRNLGGLSGNQVKTEFYIELANVMAQKKWLDLSFLIVDGRVASAVYGFKYNQRFYYYVTAFDPDYANYSIGNLHIMHLLESAIKDGLSEFDFLRGLEAYKLYWSRSIKNNIQLIVGRRKRLPGIGLSLFRAMMRLDELTKRGLRQNFYLYLDKRRQQRTVKKTVNRE